MRLRDYLHINVWLLPILIILVPVILVLFGSSFLTTPSTYYKTVLDTGWSVSYDQTHLDDAKLTDINLGASHKGDIVVLSNKIPSYYVPSACIMFRSMLAVVTVTVDDKVIYTYGNDYKEAGRMVPKHYNFVPLNKIEHPEGKTFTIKLEATEEDSFSGLASVQYGNRFDLEHGFLQSRRLPFFIGGFLTLFAFLLLTLSSYLYMYHSHDLSLIFSSVISFVLGAYNLAFNDIFCFISDADSYFCVLEYVSLYSVPFAIISFLISSHPELNSNLNKVISAINILFPVITLILHLTSIIHINIFVFLLHLIALTEAVIILPQLVLNLVKHYKERTSTPEYTGMTSDSILVIGLAIFILCSVVDIIKYNILKFFFGGGEAYVDINFMTIGALCFVLTLFVFYFYHGIEHINAVYMKEHLEGLAYTDSLTGLMNRAKCMQYMAAVHGRFAIISLDLDNLKTVNDSLGHQEGDRMIKSFADIMKQAFVGAQLIGRTGGDEFLVAIEQPRPHVCEDMIYDLKSRMEIFNKSEKTINLSASCGFAYSNEANENDANSVFVLADNRMYKEKEAHHAAKLDRFVNDIMSTTSEPKGGEADHV
ncbi:GGDEF domain-containing protein [Butyrivibrio sp. AE3004]|uniref:GGDEF domain-containing protein n=1 Tax=Butyrivibrio sp. AE3004 TaxID=1506994 RepID=UPI000494883F|nr:GGDEF domain-containing protein [Butyrivibrio sp. AE3004]